VLATGIQIKFKTVYIQRLCGIFVTNVQWATRAVALGKDWIKNGVRSSDSSFLIDDLRTYLEAAEKRTN